MADFFLYHGEMRVVNEPSWLRETEDGVSLRVRVQPRAKRTEVAGVHGDALKIRVAAPPADGAANAALCSFLAQTLGVARRDVEIVSGASARSKRILVAGLSAADVLQAIDV